MKRHFSLMTLLLCLFVGGGMFSSCSDDDNKKDGPKEVTSPFTSVTAVDGTKTTSAVISDADKTIKFAMEELTDVSKVSVTIKVATGVLLKTPAQATSTQNLTSPVKVTVHNGMKEVTYMMTATPKVIPMPILTAKVGSTDAVVDGQSITISYKSEMGDINGILFDFTMRSGATIKSPVDKTFNLEMAEGAPLVVTYEGTDYNYIVKATDYVDPLINKGWTDVTSNYAPLPAYIKVYKTEKLLNSATKNVGYIAVMSPGKSTMGALGAGVNGKKSIYELAAQDASWNVLLVGIESTAQPMIFRNGQFVQDAGGYTFPTLTQDNKGVCSMGWSEKYDDKLYKFGYRTGAYTKPTKAQGTLWEAQNAESGLLMVLWDGKVQTSADMISNTGIDWGYGADAARYANTSVGITPYGKIYAFAGQHVDNSTGLTIPEVGQVMKDLGCVSAMCFERSGSPDMLINGKKTVENSKVFGADPSKSKKVQGAIGFK